MAGVGNPVLLQKHAPVERYKENISRQLREGETDPGPPHAHGMKRVEEPTLFKLVLSSTY